MERRPLRMYFTVGRLRRKVSSKPFGSVIPFSISVVSQRLLRSRLSGWTVTSGGGWFHPPSLAGRPKPATELAEPLELGTAAEEFGHFLADVGLGLGRTVGACRELVNDLGGAIRGAYRIEE
jgi:hypothetical protein